MSMPSWTSPRASGEDLAHLAGHRPREAFLVLGHELRRTRYRISPRFGAGVRRHIGSAVSAALIGHRDVRRGALLEAPDDVALVRRVAALERRAAGGSHHSPAMKWRNVEVAGGAAVARRAWRSRSCRRVYGGRDRRPSGGHIDVALDRHLRQPAQERAAATSSTPRAAASWPAAARSGRSSRR